MRQHWLRALLGHPPWLDGCDLPDDPIRPQRSQKIELAIARGRGAAVGKVDDLALPRAFDRRVGRIHEAGDPLRKPMVAPGLPLFAVHALLHDDPFAVVGDDKTVQVKVEAVLNCCTVDLCDEAAGCRQATSIEAHALANCNQLAGGLPGVPPSTATDMNTEFA
ncbi:hypothetical protein D9M70_508380 [compost metagenome]